MVCEYYIQSELVIIYYDMHGVLLTTRANSILEKGYIMVCPHEDSDDDYETKYDKWKEELKRRIEKYTYVKMLYDDSKWLKKSYDKNISKI